MSRARLRNRNQDNIPGLTTLLTAPFAIGTASLIGFALVDYGIVSSVWGSVTGVVLAILFLMMLQPTYRHLLDNDRVSRVGCLGGLYTYAIGLVILALLVWRLGVVAGGLVGVVLVTVSSIAISFWVTAREPGRNRRRRRGR